ncbi:hypothetical protein F8388_001819 [Cannabis sativa]|uniref:Fatty acid hydroxylase domain-containing protein n=1 Tax=Cannabis sativa TaxID=3483 RepID=A0A7J6EY42_CANSA|nr:hypothetical protein F8388_001819 [Cannabis sativa]
MDSEQYLQLFVEESNFYNHIVLGTLLPARVWEPLPHFFQSWLRNYIGGVLLYLLSGFLWCFYIYYLKRNVYLPRVSSVTLPAILSVELNLRNVMTCWDACKFLSRTNDKNFQPEGVEFHNILNADAIPSNKAMLLQIYVAMKAMPWYCALPSISEYMIENGWTRCFSRINDIGWLGYFIYLAAYLVIVEFGIYWMHRELHDIKPLYKYLHATHHIYNKQNTLSPFAGLAFHPLDGILQAVPHVIALFIVPVQLTTHLGLLFIEAIWTANIHDCIHGKLWPIMGAGFHTIHHTTYRHNYGHYTVWMDWMFGTLRDPLDDGSKKEI